MVAASVLLEAHEESSEAFHKSLPEGSVKLTDEQQHHYSRLGLDRVFYLLAGLALENIMKGILIARDKSLLSKGMISNKKILKHNLSDLFKEVGLALSDRELNLVERVSETVVWAGRYPVPKHESARALRPIPGSLPREPGCFTSGEAEMVYGLWARLGEITMTDPRCPKYQSVSSENG